MKGLKAWWFEFWFPADWETFKEFDRTGSFAIWFLTIGLREHVRYQKHRITQRYRTQTCGLDKHSKWETKEP